MYDNELSALLNNYSYGFIQKFTCLKLKILTLYYEDMYIYFQVSEMCLS